jgi:riboflavin synthase
MFANVVPSVTILARYTVGRKAFEVEVVTDTVPGIFPCAVISVSSKIKGCESFIAFCRSGKPDWESLAVGEMSLGKDSCKIDSWTFKGTVFVLLEIHCVTVVISHRICAAAAA